jgi:hypothetical protein
MKLKLQENPREWQKFVLVITGMLAVGAIWLQLRGVISPGAMLVTLVILHLVIVLALAKPTWFRAFYRGGMTVTFHIGQVMGKVLLTLIFLLVLTPTGLLLRLFGKDLLALRKPEGPSYWRPAKTNRHFDRQF